MRALVTGAAGFIGSSLVKELIHKKNNEIVGVDAFTDYYAPDQKMANVSELLSAKNFKLLRIDLRTAELERMLREVDVVFHLAGQPGVRTSWGSESFRDYVEHNVLVTQRLLQGCHDVGVSQFVYASSSSVYGNALQYPTDESVCPRPFSPYGVTKLAGEHLCTLYGENFGMGIVSLRFFTVYGPAQRPDMAIHRMIECALDGTPFRVFGNGEHVRSFTYVADVVDALRRAGEVSHAAGQVVNIAGGSTVDMNTLISLVNNATGEKLRVEYGNDIEGDVKQTDGSIDAARELLDWTPTIGLEQGIAEQVQWHLARR